jgi:hypothetical protein
VNPRLNECARFGGHVGILHSFGVGHVADKIEKLGQLHQLETLQVC